ncbi:PAS domain S-box protein [Lichenicoccus sp.]|uniref:PAS domain S-box protein n=1 Tax=Lichenicoccus sp. TaxID=2781899 RepID=UPI003D126982
MTSPRLATVPSFLAGGGDVGARLRDHDWSRSPLGEPAGWSPVLKIVTGIMLAANQPMFAVWGPSRAMIYNTAYADILAGHHPAALGRPFMETWSEVRDDVGPIMDRAHAGESIAMDDIGLILHRRGVAEEAHFSFSYTPLRREDGSVGGVFCACTETTSQVLSQRQTSDAERRHRQILDGAIDYAIVALDLDGRVTRWNEGARRVLGWSEAEMLGESIDRLFTPEDRARDRARLEMRLSGTGVADGSWHVRRSGERFWATGEMTPLKDEAGAVVGYVKVLRDRTEQRLAESRLLESEARFRSLTEAIPGFVWVAGRDGLLTYTSPRWHDYSGLEPGRAAGDEWAESVHPDDRDAARAAWAAAVASGERYEVEFRLRAADGSYRWWLARALPRRNAHGAIILWAGVCTDIETIVAAREALARSREELEALVAERTADRNRMWQLSAEIMLVARFDGTICAVNPAWSMLLGWTEQELLSRNFMSLVHPDDIAATESVRDALAAGATIRHFEKRCRHRDGSYRWLSWTGVPDARFIHAVGRDITVDREQAEALAHAEAALRQSQKMEAVGQLTGGIAHDFNNLLTGITGSLELLHTRMGQGRLADLDRYVAAAQGACKRAAALTHRLLAFSRQQTLDPKPTDLNRLAAGMAELIRRTVGPEVEIELRLAPGLWTTLVDPNQLENALLNLCINARDAMPDGGRLTIETVNVMLDEAASRARGLPRGDYVSLHVRDTGLGMTPSVIARAFDPFFTTKPIGKGTGLGLSMIYGFARQSGGEIRIKSEIGHGTTMSLLLPRHDGTSHAEESAIATPEVMQAEHGASVLVVDDEPTVRMLVSEVLEDLGYDSLEAPDGATGLDILRSDARVDLLITDIGLPGGLNGRQLAESGRTMRAGLKVLFITGYDQNAARASDMSQAGTGLLTKPFTMDTLTGRIRDLLASERGIA